MRVLSLILVSLGLLLPTSIYARTDELKEIDVGVVEFLPYFYKKDGRLQGTVIEKFDRIAVEAGYKTNYKLCPMKRLVELNKQGELDVILLLTSVFNKDDILVSDERLCEIELMSFTKSKETVSRLEDLKGKRIGMFRGFCFGGLIDFINNQDNQIDCYEVSTHEQLFKMLELNRVDYVINYRRPSEFVLKDVNIANLNSATIKKFQGHMLVSTKAKNADPQKLMIALNTAYKKLLTANELTVD